MRNRILPVLIALVLLLMAAGGVWRYGFQQALGQEAARGQAVLALAADRLVSQLKRYQSIAVLTAEHPRLSAQFLQSDTLRVTDKYLLETADKTAALTMFYMDAEGNVLAQAHDHLPSDPANSPHYRRALTGALGRSHGVYSIGSNEETARRAFFFAAPDFDQSGRVEGALIVVADLEYVEWEWRGEPLTMFFVDEGGQVFVSNRSELLFWQTSDTGFRKPDGLDAPVERRMIGAQDIWEMDWGPYVPLRALHLERNLPVIGLRAKALVDLRPTQRLAWFQAAAFGAVLLTLGALLLLAIERRRALAEANQELEARVSKRTAELKRAQSELVQAGKLSALGQMSAGISHELNQPLMAIQQFADNGRAFLERDQPGRAGENLSRIADMSQRMGRIIRNLRAFARNEQEQVTRVDLVAVIDAAVELTEVRMRHQGVALNWVPDDAMRAIFVSGGEVRLTQVFVNLINNATDAMSTQDSAKSITITVREQGPRIEAEVADTGPGIADPEKIFDPFFTTKAVGSGEGMGLGLSISYGIVQSFGGNIRAGSHAGGGAAMTVVLDRWTE